MTNALPVHRMVLRVGQQATAPAAYVRAVGLTVERPEQSYLRLADEAGQQRYQYTAPSSASLADSATTMPARSSATPESPSEPAETK